MDNKEYSYCTKCGNKVKKSDMFCPKCGNRVNEPLNDNSIKQTKNTIICRYCKKEVDKRARICPYCRKKLKGSVANTLAWIVLIVIGIAVVGIMFGTSDLKITSEKGQCNSLGIAYYDGAIKNKGNSDISNVRITYICYNSNREEVGKLITKIKYIKAGETLKYKAEGLVKCDKNISCSSKIDRYYEE